VNFWPTFKVHNAFRHDFPGSEAHFRVSALGT
jgi:hypothetical protein